eukprot:GDKJ01010259.1.p1 GENE.GDKJ01010259.1~~GDKJ01010259.1.p1  ORF type:complete len:118 (+),score=1.02 GDKJ01010259.1:2-355(+)
MRQKVDEVQKYSDTKTSLKTECINPSVLVACLAAKGLTGNAADEWLYEMDKSLRSNPYAATNDALHGFWIDGSLPSIPPPSAQEPILLPQVSKWIQHVVTVISTSENAAAAKSQLTY